ncbi:MAG: Glu/Leu/Phe/Val family dehydrogenase [Flavobacteriaceae bacterium]
MTAELMEIQDLRKRGLVFTNDSFNNHEQIVFCQDEDTGLKAIIGIHNTVLGPALGGTRMWNYSSEAEALNDVLRLSRGMTFKSAVAGLNLGGGKAVIIGDAKTQKNDRLMRRFGRFVDSLSGNYITAEDVGMETRDMDVIREATKHVTGVSESLGGSGNPSPVTAYGVYQGMKAAAGYGIGNDDLKDKRILVQGVGHVGETLVSYLAEEGADILISDINESRVKELSQKYGATAIDNDRVFDQKMDIYAPCALGASLNTDSIKNLSAKVVAGAANNQLADEHKHGLMLKDKGIFYAPDFVINAGGIINVYAEIAKYDRATIMSETKKIYNTTLSVFEKAELEGLTPHEAAFKIAEERINSSKK